MLAELTKGAEAGFTTEAPDLTDALLLAAGAVWEVAIIVALRHRSLLCDLQGAPQIKNSDQNTGCLV